MKESLIILIFGASGSGKSTLMEQLLISGGQYSIHRKGTDRPARKYDDVEITCIKDFKPEKYDYVYQTYGYKYGIERQQIDAALKREQHHFIICNDISTIKSLKRDYGNEIKVIFHYFDAPYEVLFDIQKKRGIEDDEINERLAKTKILYRLFVEEWHLFDGALTNYLNENPIDLKLRMEDLLSDLIDNNASQRVIDELSIVTRELKSQHALKNNRNSERLCFYYNANQR